MTDEYAFTGRQALVLEQQLPVTLPAGAEKLSDPRQFHNQLNAGRGGGFVLVDQRVPVEAGQAYDLRFAWRSEGLVRELRGGRPGYAMFSVWIFWGSDKGGGSGHVWAYRGEVNHDRWQIEHNPRSGYTQILGLPYTAPAETTYAQIRLQLVVNTDARPRVFVDQIEFSPSRKR